MTSAPRIRHPSAAKQRARTSWLRTRLAFDAVRGGLIPAGAVLVVVSSAALGVAGLLPTAVALAAAILAALVLLLYLGERPLLAAGRPRRAQVLGGVVGALWLAACYAPFHLRIFPGTPLVDAAQMTAGGAGLPLRIPAAGHGAIDLLLEGKLAPSAGGGAAAPVHFRLTLADAGGGEPRILEGMFEDKLRTRRLGRRGTAVVHQSHTADVRLIPNPARGDLTVTQLTLDPERAAPITLSVYAHRLPGLLVLGLAVAALFATSVAFDRLGPIPETDGALTLATGAVLGTGIIFWTSNAIHPDFSTLIGSAIFGGALGFAAGALLWWVAKRFIATPAR